MPSGSLEFPEIAAVYARFAALAALSSDLGGWLLLSSGFARDGIATVMAANVTGAASLSIEADAARAKQALRAGVCDFVVNNLDEALRILKNEIRKRRPVSVVLTGAVDATVAEIAARGVQPEILAFPAPELMERGARLLGEGSDGVSISITWSVNGELIPPQHAKIARVGDPGLRWLPALDALAVASLEIADARVRWIEASPRYLGRAFVGQRFLRMTDAEADAFIAAVRAAVKTGAISVGVSVTRDNEEISIAP